ncbi:MAG: TIGR02300 family protein [Alphaproteobacteria bacterium]
MAKPEWGAKRACPHCGTRFYDLRRETIVCPRCDTPYDAVVGAKPKRVRAPADKNVEAEEVLAKGRKSKPEVVVEGEPEDLEKAGLEKIEDTQKVDNDKDTNVIEDASELSEDKNDVAEVIDKVDEEER